MGNVLKLKSEELRLMQLNELELIVEVDRICRKNGISYSLDGGTLLGAVRHRGFIPWDDDADIIFTRKEYDRFYEACKIDLNKERFFFQDYRTDSEYRWGYGKMRHLETEFVRSGQEHMKYKTGVCIDIFPEDNVPDGYLRRRLFYAKNYCLRKIMYSELGKKTAKSAILREWYKTLSLISIDKVFRSQMRMAYRVNKKDTKLICHTMLPNPGPNGKYGMPKEFLEEYQEMEFEGMKFMVTKKWDEFLKYFYGDYMELPPEEKRVGPAYPSKISLSQVTLEEIQNRYRRENLSY